MSRELDETIYAEVDPEKMKQAVGNLLSNAIKYSTDTKKIFIRLFKKSEQVCIEVEDRGMGIPEDKLSRIFEQFYRIEQKESISGTGLGLTVVKEIIEAHSGTISGRQAKSEKEAGLRSGYHQVKFEVGSRQLAISLIQ